jgi:hypothetical protein
MRSQATKNQQVLQHAALEVPEEPEMEVIEIAANLEDGEVFEEPEVEVISISSDSDEDVEVISISSDEEDNVPRRRWAGVALPPMVVWPPWAGIEPSIGEYWFNEDMHYRITFGETYFNEWFASHVVTAADFENYDWMAYYNNE